MISDYLPELVLAPGTTLTASLLRCTPAVAPDCFSSSLASFFAALYSALASCLEDLYSALASLRSMRRRTNGSFDGAPGLLSDGCVTGPGATADVAEPVAVEPAADEPDVPVMPAVPEVVAGVVTEVAPEVEPVVPEVPEVPDVLVGFEEPAVGSVVAVEPVGDGLVGLAMPALPVESVVPPVPVPVAGVMPVALVDPVVPEAPLTPVDVVPLVPLVPEVEVVVSVVAGVVVLGVVTTAAGVAVDEEVVPVDWAWATLAMASTADPIKSL